MHVHVHVDMNEGMNDYFELRMGRKRKEGGGWKGKF